MTDMNGGIPTPPGQNPDQNPSAGGTQAVPLQPTQPAAPAPQGGYQPYASAQQPYEGQQAYGYANHGYTAQQPYGAGAQQTYEAEPVAVHAQHAAQKGSGGKTFLILF